MARSEGTNRDGSGENENTSDAPPSACSESQRIAERTSRNSTSRRSRSSSRTFRCRFSQKERNFMAAMVSMFVVVFLSTALAEPNWLHLSGGGCRDYNGRPIHYIGAFQFFYLGEFERNADNLHFQRSTPKTSDKTLAFAPKVSQLGANSKYSSYNKSPKSVYKSGPLPSDVLLDCVDPSAVQLMRSMIALCFIAIVLSLLAFLLDVSGPSPRLLKSLRRNALFSILTVLVCVTINGFWYWMIEFVDHLQRATKPHSGSKVVVEFSTSFYLVAACGALSVIGAACNLLRRHHGNHHHHHRRLGGDRDALLAQIDGPDATFMTSLRDSQQVLAPPPYSP